MTLRGLSLLSACSAVIALALHAKLHPVATPAVDDPTIRTPLECRRAPEQTFLTFPEWFLVYSPDEYADVMATRPPSEFPYLGHIGQFWQGYRDVYGATKDKYPFNGGYHMMVVVIGTSMAGEYVWKWGYETIIGRLSEASRFGGMTTEDQLAADVARNYVTFLDSEPFYKFDYVTPLKDLWTKTGYWGPDPIRKWERKYFLTSEYAAKIAYCWVIQKSSETVYGAQEEVTTVVLDRLPAKARADLPTMKVLQEFSDGTALANLPRYQAFTRAAVALSQAGVNFLEVAGNRDAILVSAIVPDDFADTSFKIVMKQPIITRPGKQRIVLTVAVPELGTTIRKLDQPSCHLEHIYDY
jgi:hypothetical protein